MNKLIKTIIIILSPQI